MSRANNIEKYFWNVKPEVIDQIKKILKNPRHPRFAEKIYLLLSRCDDPQIVFSLLDKKKFIENWPRIRRYWIKKGGAEDFRYWWEAIYEEILNQKRKIKKTKVPYSKFFRKIGRILRNKRIEKGITQKDLAFKVGLRQPDISNIEQGKTNITLETLIKLCKALDIKSLSLDD
ncbi:MAG: helix-turn-helix transcriptional regulator [Candidatus Omnitrophica bacterium]|nr:helix-turn-helix transcriptional regulator [Candidatus Omnitrophota bacterium]